jgi:DNA-binding NtrC family response regulator
MPILATAPQPSTVWEIPGYTGQQQRNVRVLVLSPDQEVRQSLRRTLEDLSTDVTLCSNRKQGEEVLARQAFELVFCDSHLPDGSFSDLIHPHRWAYGIPRVAVIVRKGDWELHMEALEKGAFAVLHWPGCITDVELAILRAIREEFRSCVIRAIS